MDAIRILRAASTGIPDRILRFFDLIIFLFQIKQLTAVECKAIRQQLMARGEYIPACFKNCSFEDGLPQFYARLLDRSLPRIGSDAAFDQRLDQSTFLFERVQREGDDDATNWVAKVLAE
jgi:hypothetical protein